MTRLPLDRTEVCVRAEARLRRRDATEDHVLIRDLATVLYQETQRWGDELRAVTLRAEMADHALQMFVENKFQVAPQERLVFIEGYIAGAQDYCDGPTPNVRTNAEEEWEAQRRQKAKATR